MSVAENLITAEEYAKLPDNGQPTELVKGRVIALNVPTPRHGQVCIKIGRLLGNFADEHNLGHVVANDSGVITGKNPDTVRGPDLSFYSYKRVPRGPIPPGYLPVMPEIVFEVKSPSDRWSDIIAKVGEFLRAGVDVACVLDIDERTMHVYRADAPVKILAAEDEFTLPDILGDFRAGVRQFFE